MTQPFFEYRFRYYMSGDGVRFGALFEVPDGEIAAVIGIGYGETKLLAACKAIIASDDLCPPGIKRALMHDIVRGVTP